MSRTNGLPVPHDRSPDILKGISRGVNEVVIIALILLIEGIVTYNEWNDSLVS